MVPKNLRYAETHEWTLVEGDICTIGITKFAVEQLTDVVYLEIKKEVGDAVNAAEETADRVRARCRGRPADDAVLACASRMKT